ncbi:glutathione S-transferase family protein [Devosia algicola]|uniref:Glutathione S-transferase family protein n=1 Tax=Devosia algicola TaxID=3026418 RepID=A0ABY7YL42_9HYPH|nr:glutathione S-transferase family protein [Devosia algicola]WDR01907.1 glutathione S-transferase family protein [Devosia algicola]
MPTLLHHPLDPSSRLARLMLAEYGVPVDLEEVKPWLRDPDFLEINPAATLPILVDDKGGQAVGCLAVLHMIEDLYAPTSVDGLLPTDAGDRAEMWRLFEWVNAKAQ